MNETIEIIPKHEAIFNPYHPQSVAEMENCTPIAGAKSYYRSKILTAHFSINPLVSGAIPLFLLHSKLKQLDADVQLYELKQNLIHEINAFETNAQNRGYRPETIVIARYTLCALLDETILHSSWPYAAEWNYHKLLTIFHPEQLADEYFFLILQRISEDPNTHIELLEFIYIILSSGYEGHFREKINGKRELENIIDDLYQLIKLCRQDPKALLQTTLATSTASIKLATPWWRLLIKTAAITLILVTTIYLSFSAILNESTASLRQQLQTLSTSINSHE